MPFEPKPICRYTDMFDLDFHFVYLKTFSNDSEEWCEETFGERIWTTYRVNGMIQVANKNGIWDSFYGKYCFFDKNDAIMFKLTWMKNG